MIVSISQPAYLPWLGYFERISRSDKHVVLNHVQFEKNSLINRNRIRTDSGMQWLTVPVRTARRFGQLPIVDVEIANDLPWRRKHWGALEQNYARAEHFSEQAEAWAILYQHSWGRLHELLDVTMTMLVDAFAISTPLVYSTSLEIVTTKSKLVLDICQSLGATQYLSGPLGRNYLDREAFEEAGISVDFHEHRPPTYRQAYSGFVPGLSALDALFNLGRDQAAGLLASRSSV